MRKNHDINWGTWNGLFLREKQIDYVDVVIASVLVEGKDTAMLVDGMPLTMIMNF